MAIVLKSVFAAEMQGYLDLLKAANRNTEEYLYTFHSLDSYLVKNNKAEKSLSEDTLAGWLKSRDITGKSKNYEIGRIRVFARYLAALEIPAFEPELCKEENTYKAYTFSNEEISRIFEVADSGEASYTDAESGKIFPVVLRILYGCGLRVGEALALKWEDVDLENGILVISQAKNNKQRRIPIHDSLLDILSKYNQRRTQEFPNEKNLFINRERTDAPYDYQTFGYWFLKVLSKAKIYNQREKPFERGISTHVLRHNFAFRSFQKAVAEGRALEETAPYLVAYLGHESFFGTEKYLTTDYTMYTDSQERVATAIQSVFPEVIFE